MKSVVVVTDKELKNHGRVLCHLLSKKDNVKAVLWDYKLFEENEKKITGQNHIIFLGDTNVSKVYIPLIGDWHSDQGIRWGYDNHKAVIYRTGIVDDTKYFENELKNYWKEIAGHSVVSFMPLLAPLGVILPFDVSLIYMAYAAIRRYKQKKNERMNQYTFGIKKFMETSLHGFIGE